MAHEETQEPGAGELWAYARRDRDELLDGAWQPRFGRGDAVVLAVDTPVGRRYVVGRVFAPAFGPDDAPGYEVLFDPEARAGKGRIWVPAVSVAARELDLQVALRRLDAIEEARLEDAESGARRD